MYHPSLETCGLGKHEKSLDIKFEEAHMTYQQAVYNSEDGKWYKRGDDPWTIRVHAVGEKVRPIPSVEASTYGEAFETLFEHPVEIPALMRSQRRVELA